MITEVSSGVYALQAQSSIYTGIKYASLDCQGFVEQVLRDCGVRKPDGSVYNWKGSNHMWRDALSWKGTIEQCKTQFGCIPPGAWVFIVKRDGGEKARGYHDNEGNATHVGIYCRSGSEPVRDSTKTSYRDGVGYRPLTGFTHVGLPYMITFNQQPEEEDILKAVSVLRNNTSTDSDFLRALKTLTKYLEGV